MHFTLVLTESNRFASCRKMVRMFGNQFGAKLTRRTVLVFEPVTIASIPHLANGAEHE